MFHTEGWRGRDCLSWPLCITVSIYAQGQGPCEPNTSHQAPPPMLMLETFPAHRFWRAHPEGSRRCRVLGHSSSAGVRKHSMAPVQEHQERLNCEASIGPKHKKAFVFPHGVTGVFRAEDEMCPVLSIHSGCSSSTGWGEHGGEMDD